MKKIVLISLFLGVITSYFLFDGQRFVSVDYFQATYEQNPGLTALLYFGLYVLVTAFSLPAAALLTVIGGMIFGLGYALLLVSFASSIGATLAFLGSRFLLRDWVQKRLGHRLEKIHQGVAKEGGNYLFSLRLLPIFPFWVINVAFGLTTLPTVKFYLISQFGMLPGTLVFVNAGAQLGAVDTISLSGILSPAVLASFVLLAVFPLAIKRLMTWWQRRGLYRGFTKPKLFDTNLIVIGGGSAGLVTAYIAAAVKAKVTLIEKHHMGGDCLNTGCVPSKALIRAAKSAAEIRKAPRFGVTAGEPQVDFSQVMSHVHNAIDSIAPHDSMARYESLGVNCIAGDAQLVSPWTVKVNGNIISARNIVIATGARPAVPDIEGLAAIDYLSSDNLWQLTALPKRLLILGGGPIGCEMAQAFQRLGSQVVLVQRGERLLPREDSAASQCVAEVLSKEGISLYCQAEVTAFQQRESQDSPILATVTTANGPINLDCSHVLVATGRHANSENLGLEALGIACQANGTVVVNDYLQTTLPNIYACGDICGPYQLTHASAHQAWYAAVNSLFGRFKTFSVDNRLMPSVVYTDPEVASVGISEDQAKKQGINYEVTHYPLSDFDRAITDGADDGFVKIITASGKDQILGVTLAAPAGGEILAEFVTAMKHGKGLNSILGTIHSYPSFSDANKLAAGQWKREHAPQRILGWLLKFHSWRIKQ